MSNTQSQTFVNLSAGEPAPWFHQRSSGYHDYAFDSSAGRYIVMAFLGSSRSPNVLQASAAVAAHRRQFDDERASFFGVTTDPADETNGAFKEKLPGIRFFWDFDQLISRLYGAVAQNAGPDRAADYRQFWIVLDPMLRVIATFPIDQSAAAMNLLTALPHPDKHVGFEVQAPIMILPRVFEPEFCKTLIDAYDARGGDDSGVMREIDGKTVQVINADFKRRKDFIVQDQEMIKEVQKRIHRRVAPEIAKAYCFKASRMERYLVGCYAAEDGGHFRPHRDNTTKGTAHRCFAVSINLNDDFDGGELSFPEFGRRQFKAPPGAALIFPGALLHAVSKVTRGRRYAFLPFVYDDAAAKLREANAKFMEGSTYKVMQA